MTEKIFVVGSIKIDSKQRKYFFKKALASLRPVLFLFSWNFNIVGNYSQFCKEEILKIDKTAKITSDDNSPYYKVVKNQLDLINDPGAILFFFQEDHWFVCPHKNLFFYLLKEFINSKSDMMRITHLIDFWDSRQDFYELISDKILYKEYLVDLRSQEKIWQKWPGSYVTSLPGIYKMDFASQVLEINKPLLVNSKKSVDFELHDQKAEEFLNKRTFKQMIPTFHVLREVFLLNLEERAIDAGRAEKIIKLRDAKDPVLKPWRKYANVLLSPLLIFKIIKNKIK